jgi:hypothetical protein
MGGGVLSLDTVYVHIRHWAFWYGIYGFCDKSCNDEVTIYSDRDRTNFLGYFEITTINCLKYLLNNELDKEDDAEYWNEIEDFLESEKDIDYSYIYPRDFEDITDQVKHFAPTNEKGEKPVYINMWTKQSESLDSDEIKNCVKIIVKEFFHGDVLNVEILGIPTYEETKLIFDEESIHWAKE